MPVKHLEHYMVVSSALEETRDFYCEVLGLTAGDRPALGFDGYWLYAGSTACVHLADRESYTDYKARAGIAVPQQIETTGAVDHIAFSATDFDSMIECLHRRKLSFRQNSIEAIGLRQIFVQDPNKVTLELNFHDSER